MKTTYIDRGNTNQKVYEMAYQVLQTENEKKPVQNRKTEKQMKRQVRHVSEVLEGKKLSLLGHIIRRDFSHPTYQVTFDTPADAKKATPLLYKKPSSKRRQGRPRLNWTNENLKRAWEHIKTQDYDDLPLHIVTKPYDNGNRDMNKTIVRYAWNHKSPFEGMKAKKLIFTTTGDSERNGRLNPFGQIP